MWYWSTDHRPHASPVCSTSSIYATLLFNSFVFRLRDSFSARTLLLFFSSLSWASPQAGPWTSHPTEACPGCSEAGPSKVRRDTGTRVQSCTGNSSADESGRSGDASTDEFDRSTTRYWSTDHRPRVPVSGLRWVSDREVASSWRGEGPTSPAATV